MKSKYDYIQEYGQYGNLIINTLNYKLTKLLSDMSDFDISSEEIACYINQWFNEYTLPPCTYDIDIPNSCIRREKYEFPCIYRCDIHGHKCSYKIELAYETTDYTKLMDMIDKELNPVMVEPDGTYLISELTTWKKYSKFKKLSSVKFIQYVQKSISNWLSQIKEDEIKNNLENLIIETIQYKKYINMWT